MDLQNDFLMHDLIDYGKKFDKTNNMIISVDMYFRMIPDQIFDDHDKGYADTRTAFAKHIQKSPGRFSTFTFFKCVKIAKDEALAAGKALTQGVDDLFPGQTINDSGKGLVALRQAAETRDARLRIHLLPFGLYNETRNIV